MSTIIIQNVPLLLLLRLMTFRGASSKCQDKQRLCLASWFRWTESRKIEREETEETESISWCPEHCVPHLLSVIHVVLYKELHLTSEYCCKLATPIAVVWPGNVLGQLNAFKNCLYSKAQNYIKYISDLMLAETFLEINILMDINIGHLMRYIRTVQRLEREWSIKSALLSGYYLLD